MATGSFRRPASRIARTGAFFGFGYRVAAPTEWLYKTGSGVRPAGAISKKCVHGPFQQVAYVDISPVNYHFAVHSMSSEMVPFQLPMVFTIGPVDPAVNMKQFEVYCQRLSTLSREEIKQIVEGIIQGEVRVLSASMTIRQMFSGREQFRVLITDHVQKDLDALGLRIYNANIAEMHDLDDKNKYFENLKMKALEGANTEARVQVAEARNRGDVGEAEKQADTQTRKAEIQANMQTRTAEIQALMTQQTNERNQKIVDSNADLAVKKSEAAQRQQNAAIATDVAVRQQQAELETALAKKEALQRTEVLRATQLAEASVDAEAKVRKAEGDAAAAVKRAEGAATAGVRQAEGAAQARVKTVEGDAAARIRSAEADAAAAAKQAEGEAAATKLRAEANLFAEMKRAEGVQRMAEAKAAGMAAMLKAAGGNMELAKFYLGLQSGLFVDMAAQTAAAIQGLNPKINVWNTGAAGEGGADTMAPLRNLFMGMPPMLDALAQQTNVQLPSFLPQVKAQQPTNGGAHVAAHR